MFPRRTRATHLSDDELILLDVLFSHCGTSYRLLRRRDFVAQWNHPSHDLDDVQLLDKLARMVSTGWLDEWQDRKRGHCFRVTPAGGRQWEMERLPAWDRYATDAYRDLRSGKPSITIAATTEKCRDDFWRIGCECGMFAHSRGRIRKASLRNYALIPWKSFPLVYVLAAVLDGWDTATDWRTLEQRRTWWRSVRENDKFWEPQA